MDKKDLKKLQRAIKTLREAQADFSYIFQHAINKEIRKHISNADKKDETLRDFYEDYSNEAAWDLIYRISNADHKDNPLRDIFTDKEEKAILRDITKEWAAEIKDEAKADAEEWKAKHATDAE